MSTNDLAEKKARSEKIIMLTAYDYPLAYLLDQSGVDIILVGDSLANVVLGLESTTQVGMRDMLHHCKAVSRAVKQALVVGDMPFGSYQIDAAKAAANARLFVDEGGCQAVKLEWFDNCPKVAKNIIRTGIPVMGHVGLTPQTVSKEEGLKVQGKSAAAARLILEQAKTLEQAGCFAIVLECIPKELSKIITSQLKIPTIGIGAGPDCDGQVLVTHDLIGLTIGRSPKFTKKYIDLGPAMIKAFKQYRSDVLSGQFPDDAHSFHMPPGELPKLK
jgi:3-methyl-2-oxobutanoate hydroxymethyltransferase